MDLPYDGQGLLRRRGRRRIVSLQINEQWFFSQPGLIVVFPSTPYDAKGLLKSAIRGEDPVIYFEHKRLYRWIKEEIPKMISLFRSAKPPDAKRAKILP